MFKAKIVKELTILTTELNSETCNLRMNEVVTRVRKILRNQTNIVLVDEKYKDFYGSYSPDNYCTIRFTNYATKEEHNVPLGMTNLRELLLDKELEEVFSNAYAWYRGTRITTRAEEKDKSNFLKLMMKKLNNFK